MTEERTEVKAVRVKLICDTCGFEMKPTGRVLASNPPKHPHECENHHVKRVTGHTYPRIEYVPIDGS